MLKVTLSSAEWRSLLGAVDHARSSDETRAALNGVRLEARAGELLAVACDGHRLALEALPVDAAEGELTLAPAALEAIRAACSLRRHADRIRSHTLEGGTFDGAELPRLEAGAEFPAWRQVMPAGGGARAVLEAAAPAVARACARALAGASLPGIVLALGDAETSAGRPPYELRITAQRDLEAAVRVELHAAVGLVELERGGRWPSSGVAVNARYLADALETLGGAVELELAADRDPAAAPIRLSRGSSSVRVVMPCRL